MSKFLRLFLIILPVIFCSAQAQRSEAGSYVRVVKNGGIWWFEDGRGQRFFSLGVNCIGGCFGHAEDLAMEPSRKQHIVAHLKDQGFNTAASWSSPSVWDDFYVADQIYTGFKEGQDDVFDASLWKERFEPCIREEVKPFLGRENFIGYFIDNEPKWNEVGVFEFYLSLSRQRPGSRALISFLESFYKGNIESLNNEWGLSYQSFEDIPQSSPRKVSSAAPEKRVVLKAWRNEVAKTYYERYVSLVRSFDPNHLILGVRYKGIPDLDLFKTLSPYFDVNTVNDYNRYGNVRHEFEALYKASGKPLMITEFSFSGFPDPGHRSMLFVDVYSQENRGIGYKKYVLEAARTPFMLGMHWFFWMDYPKQDESEGGFLPDENVGLVTNDESTIYEELAEWITKTNREVHSAHGTAHSTVNPEPLLTKRTLKQFTPKLDGDISEWPEETAVKPSAVTSLRGDTSFNHSYFFSHDSDALYVAGDVSDSHLEHRGGDWAWTGDSLFLHLSPFTPSESDAFNNLSLFIYPCGNGPANDEPCAVRWYGPEESKVIPSTIVKRTRVGGFTIEAKLPWSSLENLRPWYLHPWKMRVGYQNANEIYLVSWLGIVLFQTK